MYISYFCYVMMLILISISLLKEREVKIYIKIKNKIELIVANQNDLFFVFGCSFVRSFVLIS